jgi:hypothetical protein
MVQVIRLKPVGPNSVNINADENWVLFWRQNGTSFLNHFSPSCFPDILIVRLDVSARQQPTVEPSVMDQ